MDEDDISRRKHDRDIAILAALFLGFLGFKALTGEIMVKRGSSQGIKERIEAIERSPDAADAGVEAALPEESYAWPIPDTETGWNDVGSCYGMREFVDKEGNVHRGFHDGIDIDAIKGSEVVSIADGIVERLCRVEKDCDCSTLKDADCASRCAGKASCNGEGNNVSIRHADDTYSHYLHLSKVVKGIEKGSAVERGQKIGMVGDSGQSRAPHLHFSVTLTPRRPGGESKEPFCYYADLLSRLYLDRRQCIKKYGSESGYSEPVLALQGCHEYKEDITLVSAGRR